jgi:hypothetical protein
MANIDKLVVSWNFSGIPSGSSVFYTSASQGSSFQPRLVTFFTAIESYFPTAIGWTIPNNGETLDETTGKQVNVWSGGTTSTLAGTGTGAWSQVSGALIRWQTGQFANGRKIRGRTFLVPIGSANYSAGTISATTANAINAAATTLWSALPGQLVVYSRPVYDNTVKPPTLTRAGFSHPVNGSAVPTAVTYLSSRRD